MDEVNLLSILVENPRNCYSYQGSPKTQIRDLTILKITTWCVGLSHRKVFLDNAFPLFSLEESWSKVGIEPEIGRKWPKSRIEHKTFGFSAWFSASRANNRGRVKELPPPRARSQQELSEVAGALKSGRSSKKWQELNQVGREK